MHEIGLPKHELDTPILWLDLDKMEQNIAQLAQIHKQAGLTWRPKIRIFKTAVIAHKAIAAGAAGVTCSRLSEAEIMAAAGIKDILITTQIIGPRKISRLVHLRQQADVKVLVDNHQNVVELGQAATAKGVVLGVLVDVNIGKTRTGVLTREEAVKLSQRVAQTPGLTHLGLAGLEGSFLDVLERTPAEERLGAVTEMVTFLHNCIKDCREAGLPVPMIVGGGSFTYQHPAVISVYTDLLTGGAIISDLAYKMRGVNTQPSLFVYSTVTNRPKPERIVFDAGFKALPALVTYPQLLGVSGVKEMRMAAEHGIVTLKEPNTEIAIGDRFDFVVASADGTMLLHEQVYGIRDGVVETIWPIPGRGQLR